MLQRNGILQETTIKAIQESCAQSSTASEETNKRLNQVFEEKNHCKRDRDCLDQDIKKLFNVYQNMKPQPEGHTLQSSYQQDIKPAALLGNKARSPSQYHDGDNMSYSEKEALKPLPEASSWPKFSGTGEYDHMELIDYIDGLFIDVPSIPDYWITAILNTAFKRHASIWYTEMKEIHGGGTGQDGRVKKSKSIAMMRNHKLQIQMAGELEHALKCRCDQNCTLEDSANTLKDVRMKMNIGKYSPYKRSGFKEEQPFRVEFKDQPRERVSQLAKKKNSCHNWGSTEHYSNCPKAKNKVYAIVKVPEEESPIEDSESDFMGDAIREQSHADQDPREELLVQYQQETPLEIQDIQLEAGMPQDTANKNLCKHTQNSQTFLLTQTTGMAYIHGIAKKMTVCIDNSQHPFIIDSGAHFPIIARNYLDHQFPNWEKQLLPTKEKNFKSASGKMTSIGKIIKEIIIPHRKGNIRFNPEFGVLEDSHIQGLLLETDYQRMYGIHLYNSESRHFPIGTTKEKKLSLEIYQISTHDPLEELLNQFREGQLSTTLTSKQKLSLLKMLRRNRQAFAIGEGSLGIIRHHDIELYLNVERPYPPILRKPPYPASLETRK
ncbi:hypothetical protein O181_036623 [Austropuccinia psidii MF-1]|uniref:Uncharacterized protein n=1 Tax=Austropuccinia psidii MF-1 TaxID=1389203 RepID=A0A9Q3D7T2_9BASI|nr:hypothetical protein [Austropuccinia psidii MF-1]